MNLMLYGSYRMFQFLGISIIAQELSLYKMLKAMFIIKSENKYTLDILIKLYENNIIFN